MKVWKLLLCIIALVAVGTMYYTFAKFSGTPVGKFKEKKQMLTYLEKKYHQPFTINLVQYNGEGAGYYATASPKASPTIKFDVSVSQDEESGFADLYPVEFWKTTEAEPIKATIFSLFPAATLTLERKLEEAVGPNIPTLQSLHYDAGYSGVLSIEQDRDWFKLTETERQSEMKQIKTLSTVLQTNHFPVLTFIFYDSDSYDHRKGIYITQKGEIVE